MLEGLKVFMQPANGQAICKVGPIHQFGTFSLLFGVARKSLHHSRIWSLTLTTVGWGFYLSIWMRLPTVRSRMFGSFAPIGEVEKKKHHKLTDVIHTACSSYLWFWCNTVRDMSMSAGLANLSHSKFFPTNHPFACSKFCQSFWHGNNTHGAPALYAIVAIITFLQVLTESGGIHLIFHLEQTGGRDSQHIPSTNLVYPTLGKRKLIDSQVLLKGGKLVPMRLNLW